MGWWADGVTMWVAFGNFNRLPFYHSHPDTPSMCFVTWHWQKTFWLLAAALVALTQDIVGRAVHHDVTQCRLFLGLALWCGVVQEMFDPDTILLIHENTWPAIIVVSFISSLNPTIVKKCFRWRIFKHFLLSWIHAVRVWQQSTALVVQKLQNVNFVCCDLRNVSHVNCCANVFQHLVVTSLHTESKHWPNLMDRMTGWRRTVTAHSFCVSFNFRGRVQFVAVVENQKCSHHLIPGKSITGGQQVIAGFPSKCS